MIGGATIAVESPGLVNFQEEVLQMFGPVGLKNAGEAMGLGVREVLIEHFTELEQDGVHHRTADRLGAEHSGFWADTARKVQAPVQEPDGISVAINKLGLRLRYYGGTVTPGKNISWKTGKPTQWLSIAAIADAYGRRTQMFDFSGGGTGNLHFVFFRPDLAALVENLASVIKRTRSGVYKQVASTIGQVVFWLKKSVTYKADPSVLPTDDKMASRAIEAGNQALEAMWGRRATT